MSGERPIPAPGEIWRHYKGGIYEVLHRANDEATLAKVVVYREVSVKGVDHPVWVRSLDVWMETVNGAPRFERLESGVVEHG